MGRQVLQLTAKDVCGVEVEARAAIEAVVVVVI
jgi:hypothetical protein